MSDEKLFQQIFNNGHQALIKQKIEKSDFKSIKDVKVHDKKIKLKWFFLTISKEIKVTKFIVDEPLFVMETLVDDLNVEDFKLEDSIVEIEYAT